ncbi:MULTISPECIES: EAL and HDOD domain-containing protein [Gammaproteobacteria]|uniref:EAL and HDOD domain-containing protein n=1 Tax=Gammaproteobacteria TaxID=1236 RepID=UPI000DCF8221|nr:MULTISPECIES: HDOD domain-containing protein [Gammaproteobacteria]RTE87129.1 HDOD domain-containing protein [Aliidiomarina sp. B3213]TCZ93083.1 HDOD domain-containing protein [Lysobacter sp. N42]
MFFYIARQPILDRNKALFAYELLFRNGTDNAFPDISAEVATASLIENSQLQHSVNEITDQHLAFINFSENGILQDLPGFLPNQHVVVEVLETVTPSQEVFEAIKSLKSRGYKVALDDYDFNPEWDSILQFIDIIKVDLMASSRRQIEDLLALAKTSNFKLLAEKVETQKEFETCMKDGFEYFQGYFFARPEIVQKRSLTPNQLIYTQLLQACAQPELDFDSINQLMSRDVGITYKLLRYVNAPVHGISKPIESLRQAIVYLGEQQIKKFTAVIAAAQLGESKPSELVRLSIVRAHMCEQIAVACKVQIDPEKAFLTGMFSLLEALLDEPLQTIMSRIELGTEIRTALLDKKGPLAFCLGLVCFYEKANWAKVKTVAERLHVSEDELPSFYLNALNWANALSNAD